MLDFVNRCLEEFPQYPALVLLTKLRIPEADYDSVGHKLIIERYVQFALGPDFKSAV